MDDAACLARASAAALAWGPLAAPLRLVQRRENAVFEARFGNGLRAALRLHRPGYQAAEAVRQEMQLLEALADAGFACPWPQRTGDKALVVEADGGVVSLVQWIDGDTLAALPGDALPAQYRRLGALLADLHLTADAVAPSLPARPVWDGDALCGADPLWGRYWEHPLLSAAEHDLMVAARDAAKARLTGLPESGWGVIHADVLMENVLIRDGQPWLIDFDDCGIGHRALDLASALIQHTGRSERPALRDALLDGYGEAGGDAGMTAATIDVFVALRALISCGWAADRLPAGDARQALYSARAIAEARILLDT